MEFDSPANIFVILLLPLPKSQTRTTHLLTCHLHAILCGQTWKPQEVISDVMSDGPDITDSSSVSSSCSGERINMNRETDIGPGDAGHSMVTYTNSRRVRLCDPPSVFEIEPGPAGTRHRRKIRRSASESRIHSNLYRNHGLANGSTTGTGDTSVLRPTRLARYRRRRRRQHSHSRSRSRGRHSFSQDQSRPSKSSSLYPQQWRVHTRHGPFSGVKKPSLRTEALQLALVIDGETLQHALDDDNKANFLRLSRFCSSVLCCRSTPSQKVN